MNPKKLSEKLPQVPTNSVYRSLKDYFGVTLLLQRAKIESSAEGDRAVFVCSLPESPDEQFYLATRAGQPMQVAMLLKDEQNIEVLATFLPRGRAVILVDPVEGSKHEYHRLNPLES